MYVDPNLSDYITRHNKEYDDGELKGLNYN